MKIERMVGDLEFDDEELDLIMSGLNWAAIHYEDWDSIETVEKWRAIERRIGDYLYRPTTTKSAPSVSITTEEGK